MFIAALFTTARTWKQSKCPSTSKWIKKMWPIYTMEYYSTIRRSETESVEVMWMNLESVIQSKEKREREKQILHFNIHIWNLEI